MLSYTDEITLLQKFHSDAKPPHWVLSPRAVMDFIAGATLPDGTVISTKFFGQQEQIQLAIASLMAGRAVLLVGLPGTGKSYLSRLLAIAINGATTHTVHGSAGLQENTVKYTWNYALMIANGTNRAALIPSPVFAAMEAGEIVRVEEFSRLTTEVQDAFIAILSEKEMAIPELNTVVVARNGFNVIATSNTQDSGLFDMSAAIQRRFNTIVLSPPESEELEQQIVLQQILQQQTAFSPTADLQKIIRAVVAYFRQMRELKSAASATPSGYRYSSADAIAFVATVQARQTAFPSKNIAIFVKKELQQLLNKEEEAVRIQQQQWLDDFH